MPTDDFEAELDRLVAATDRGAGYRVLRELKRSDAEVTEVVEFSGTSGTALGPFVRKRIDERAQMGSVYEKLFAAQRAGRRYVHLPRIVDCWHAAGELNVVMEYVEGETLEALVGRLGPSTELAASVMPELCRAAGELHAGFAAPGEPQRPVIHRDLKPSNIIVSGAGGSLDGAIELSSLVIIDLGIARLWSEGAAADTVKFGTRAYAPPEQYGFGQTSVRSDVYALGGILFFCLTGRDPEPGRSMRVQCEAAGLPASFTDVVTMAMAFDPERRFVSAAALGRAVTAACEQNIPMRRRVEQKSVAGVAAMREREVSADRKPAIEKGATTKRGVGAKPNPAAGQAPKTDQGSASVSIPVMADDAMHAEVHAETRQRYASRPFEERHRVSTAIARIFAPLGRLLSHVPEPIGRIWNVVLYLSLAVIVLGCHWAVFYPTGANRGYPTWFLALEYFLMVDPTFAATAFLLLDKRRLRRRFPALEGLCRARLVWFHLLVMAVLLGLFITVVLVANVTGVV